MAELENTKRFAELLFSGVAALRLHPEYKTIRKKRKPPHSLPSQAQSYLDKIAFRLGISSNTIKSWIGQMGVNYIPSRIEDGKLFGILWLILEKSEKDLSWLSDLLQTTSIPVIAPAQPEWVASCLRKAKQLRDDDSFGAPSEKEINELLTRLFQDKAPPRIPSPPLDDRPHTHNLPARWSDVFIGRKEDLEAIRQWMLSPSPICLITGWGGMGKTTLALESAYAGAGESYGKAAGEGKSWPQLPCVIWISADPRGLSFNDFLDTLAYQLGRVEMLDKSVQEKRHVVRNALAASSGEQNLLLIIDSIDTADSEIAYFITNLPQRVKVMLTSREKLNQIYANASLGLFTIQLEGLRMEDSLDFLVQEAHRHIRMSNSLKKRERLEQLLGEPGVLHRQLVAATAGNPKAMALSIAYIADDAFPVKQLIQEINTAGYTLTNLFEYLFGRAWRVCHDDTRSLWQVLSFFNSPPDEHSWAAAAGLDSRRFYQAVGQMRDYALIETERAGAELRYRSHRTVMAYGEQKLSENQPMDSAARIRWGQYYLRYLDIHLKRDQPLVPYWSFLLGRDLSKVKQEWPNLHKLMAWADGSGQLELMTELMTRLSHFLSRISLPLRIEYGLKAADAAHRLGKHALEALLRIDTAGWALLEIGDLEEGLRQLETGLQRLGCSNTDVPEAGDLKALGLVFKARYYLKSNQPQKAASVLNEAMAVPSAPIIRHRALLAKGDLKLLYGNYPDAVRIYEEANEVSKAYGGEKTIEAYFNLGTAYIKCGEFEKAASAFERILYDPTKANQIELIYYWYGMAQLSAGKGDITTALQLNRKCLSLIDSWEPGFSLRTDIERYHELLSGS